MATAATSRAVSVLVEQQSVAAVQAEIRSTIRPPRSRYLREFQDAFRKYESALSPAEFTRMRAEASLILIGDYHSLEACQDFATNAVQELSQSGTELVLCLEAFYSVDQPALDECFAAKSGLETLRQRTSFDEEWGYDWMPYERMLTAARQCRVPVYGIDCHPRFDLRRVRMRDRHAAQRLAKIRKLNPEATLLVLIGESHLAPTHLPHRVRQLLPQERTLNILQNIDALYWQAVPANGTGPVLRVSGDTVCAFTSTPLEKYESYRHYLDMAG